MGMMDMFEKTVTLYHRISDTKWKRRVVEGVYIDELVGEAIRKRGVTPTSSILVIIPTTAVESLDLDKSDILVKGICTEEVVKSSKDILKLKDAYLITSVSIYDYGEEQSHWEVTAK